MVLLHLGDRDPRGLAFGRIVQRRRCTPGVRGDPGHLVVHRRQVLDFPLRRLRFPGGQPLRGGGLGGAGLPGDGAPRFGFGAPGVLRGLLAQQPDRPLGRRLPVRLLVLADQRLQLRSQRPGAGAEQVHHVLPDPADLGAVPVLARHHGIPQRGQPGLHHPVGHRGDREPLVVQAARIQRAPLLIRPVGAPHPVPHRHVHVQMRVTVAADVMQEHARDQAVTVPPLPRASRMVPGPGISGMPFQPGDRVAGRVQHRVLDLIGPGVERRGLILLAAFTGLAGRDPVGGVQHRHALDHVDGQVEVGHLVRVRAARGGADLGHLGRAGVRMRGLVRRHRGLFPFLGRPGLTARDQKFPVRADVVLVQPGDHRRVHLAGQAERRGALAGPLARRLPGRGVVRHRPGAAPGVLARRQVRHVMARMQRRDRGHGRPPSQRLPLASVADACLGSLSRTHGR
jgi:hypothetical protein